LTSGAGDTRRRRPSLSAFWPAHRLAAEPLDNDPARPSDPRQRPSGRVEREGRRSLRAALSVGSVAWNSSETAAPRRRVRAGAPGDRRRPNGHCSLDAPASMSIAPIERWTVRQLFRPSNSFRLAEAVPSGTMSAPAIVVATRALESSTGSSERLTLAQNLHPQCANSARRRVMVPSAVRRSFEISLQTSRVVRAFPSSIDRLCNCRTMARDVLGLHPPHYPRRGYAARGVIDAFPNAGARDGHQRSGV
jgi:hypothetical protein